MLIIEIQWDKSIFTAIHYRAEKTFRQIPNTHLYKRWDKIYDVGGQQFDHLLDK